MQFGEMLFKNEAERIIGCMYRVHNPLGYGFSEKVYENALAIEMRNDGFTVAQQKPIKVKYRGAIVGNYVADMIVDNKIILEIKVAKKIVDAHLAQLLNYLRATDIEVGLVLNFGLSAEARRRVYSRKR